MFCVERQPFCASGAIVGYIVVHGRAHALTCTFRRTLHTTSSTRPRQIPLLGNIGIWRHGGLAEFGICAHTGEGGTQCWTLETVTPGTTSRSADALREARQLLDPRLTLFGHRWGLLPRLQGKSDLGALSCALRDRFSELGGSLKSAMIDPVRVARGPIATRSAHHNAWPSPSLASAMARLLPRPCDVCRVVRPVTRKQKWSGANRWSRQVAAPRMQRLPSVYTGLGDDKSQSDTVLFRSEILYALEADSLEVHLRSRTVKHWRPKFGQFWPNLA